LDTFERQNWLDGDLSAHTSVATETPEFLDRTFGGESYPDTVYVTGNPMHRVDDWCSVDLDDVFHDIVDVWATEWDDDLGTLPPAEMAAAARRARERYPEHRLVVHFVQPHYPFIGPLGKQLAHGTINGKERAEGEHADGDERPVWRALRDGDHTIDSVREAYAENLWVALPYVQELLADFDGETVLTSDHGNHIGDLASPFPVRLFGHPPNVRTPELVTVPWLTVHGNETVTGVSATEPTPARPVSSADGGRPVGNTGDRRESVIRDGPLVSVVIPTHYRNDRLAAAIQSVQDQRYDPVETIVVDDSGTGHARPVAERNDVTYIEHDRQRGANRARTTGIEAASGAYVQLLDDDDRLHPEKLARQLPLLERAPEVGVAYCGYSSDDGLRLPTPIDERSVLEEALQFGPRACTNSTMLIDATVLDAVTPLADRKGADDIGFCIELAARCAFEPLEQALVYKGTTGDQRSAGADVGRELLNIVEEYEPLYESHPDIRRTALRKAYDTLGRNTLSERGWSLSAVSAFANSLRYTEGKSLSDYGLPAAALLGAPGFRAAAGLRERLSD
jgi:glycosyltransferase involved in cell wall biosynthesis